MNNILSYDDFLEEHEIDSIISDDYLVDTIFEFLDIEEDLDEEDLMERKGDSSTGKEVGIGLAGGLGAAIGSEKVISKLSKTNKTARAIKVGDKAGGMYGTRLLMPTKKGKVSRRYLKAALKKGKGGKAIAAIIGAAALGAMIFKLGDTLTKAIVRKFENIDKVETELKTKLADPYTPAQDKEAIKKRIASIEVKKAALKAKVKVKEEKEAEKLKNLSPEEKAKRKAKADALAKTLSK